MSGDSTKEWHRYLFPGSSGWSISKPPPALLRRPVIRTLPRKTPAKPFGFSPTTPPALGLVERGKASHAAVSAFALHADTGEAEALRAVAENAHAESRRRQVGAEVEAEDTLGRSVGHPDGGLAGRAHAANTKAAIALAEHAGGDLAAVPPAAADADHAVRAQAIPSTPSLSPEDPRTPVPRTLLPTTPVALPTKPTTPLPPTVLEPKTPLALTDCRSGRRGRRSRPARRCRLCFGQARRGLLSFRRHAGVLDAAANHAGILDAVAFHAGDVGRYVVRAAEGCRSCRIRPRRWWSRPTLQRRLDFH